MTYGSPNLPKPKRSAALKTLIVFVCLFFLGVLLVLVGLLLPNIGIAYTVGGLLILVGFLGSIVSAIVFVFVLILRSATPPSPPGAGPVSAAPGWYPDAQNASLLRYFDGRAWTESTRPR